MSSKIDIKLLKVIDAGHFKASPIATPGSELENFMGQLNDYFLHEKDPHGLSVVPQKGKMYAVQRTMDHCWYRARILNIMQTTAGPQASVLLVDVGEQTLIPCSRTCELPKQFENIPYQVMDCRLIAVKPLRLVTSYFDLTTTKQVSDSWTEAATKFVHSVISGCKLEVTIQREDDDGHYYVLLHATSPRKQVCVNDELVQQGFAVFTEIEDESPRKAERRKLQQEQFMQQQQQVVDAFKNHATLPYHGESTSTDEEGLSSFRANIMQRDTTVQSSLNFLRQQVAEIRQPIHGNEPVSMIPAGSENTGLSNRKTRQSPKALSSSSDDNSGRVRFVSARIPATGSGVPSLSREDDSARLKSILKTGKPTSLSTNRGEEHVATKSQWHPGQDTNISPQNPGQDMNVSSQYTGQDRGVSSHYPGQERGVSPQYPGQDRGVSQQYPGQDRGASQQYPGQENGVSPQYPGQDKGVSPQYPGQDRGVSTQYPGQDRGVSQQYPEQDIGVSPQYPGQDTNISPQYPEQDRGVSPQYPGSETYKSQQYPSRERDLPQQYPQTNNRTQWHPSQSASYEETLHNQPPLYPGPSSDRVHNASPQYPGQETDRLNNASSHYPGQQSDRVHNASLQYPGQQSDRLNNASPQYPGPSERMNSASPQYPGQQSDRVHNASPQYPGQQSDRLNNASPQYPGQQSDRVHNASPQYPGQQSDRLNNASLQYPGPSERMNSAFPQYPGQQSDTVHNASPQYPGQQSDRLNNASPQYPGPSERMNSASPQYPGPSSERMNNASPQYPGPSERMNSASPQYPEPSSEQMNNASPQYPGPSSERMYNASPQYPGPSSDRMNNTAPQYPGQQSDRMNNTSPQYPGPSSERMYNDSPQYPGPSSEQMNNASLQFPGQQSDRVHNASPQYPGPSERMNNTSTQYPGAQSDRVHNASPQYPGPSEIINNTSPLHPGKSALSSILGVVQNTSSSTDSQGFSKPTQRLPSHTGQSSSDSSHYHPQENTMSSRLPSLALSQRLPSDALSQNPRLPSEAVNQKSDSTQQTNECESSIDDGVLVHGEGAPKPYLSMDNCPLHEKGTRLNIRVPTPLQRHMWPALLRGRDVAGIASRNAGKKLAYLLPIIDQVMESSAYSELPLTNGPLALILCSNWSDAIEIYQECNKILGNRRTARVHVIFGGGAEDEQIVPVLNGCEVLVATVPCFLRMFKRGYSPLDRLCHIVFDDADILVEDFTSELKDIMRVYGRHLVSQPGRVAPRQAVIMATSWTVGVASLTHAYLGNPLIIIDDQVEAAFYSGVKQTVELCSTNQRLTRLIGFLDNADRTHEIVVFTNTAQEAESLAEILRTNNHFVLVAHEFMQPQNLADIRRQWYTPHSEDLMPILVLTDGVLMGRQLTIHNASMVIHYDLPLSKNKEKFGQRFFCMARTFTATKDHGCLSVIFITENCMRQATIAHELVRRTLQLNPSEDMSVESNNPQTINTTLLEQMAETAQMAKERDKANFDLCDFMMAYGTCRTFADNKKCTMRHIVLREEDYPYDLPTMGIVRVLVLYVLNATCLWVRILEHRNPKGEVISSSSSSKFVQMTIDMGVWYGNPDNRKKISMPRESDMCAIELDGSYHRVKVCGIVHSSSQSGMPLDTQVHFVDSGLYDVVKVSSLLQLPQQFHTLPFQAVQVFVCRVKPQDKSLQWTPKANSFVKNLVEGKELEGKVVLSLGNTMWLDPLWEKKVLKSINVTTNINNIRIELLKKGLAVENKQHIKQLRKLCDDAIDLSIYDGTEGEGALGGDSSSTLETVTLPEDDYQDVYVSAVDTPGLFFVQLTSYKSLLEEELQTKIDGGISCVQFDEDDEIAIGSLCVACFTNNDMWYRARVLGIRPDNEYDVFYVDYGDREWIPRGRLRPAWSDILTLPLQAIECSLVNIIPLENDWTPADGDALWDRCEDRLLFVKVKSKVASLMSGCHRFVVELVDTSSSIDVNFSDELVATGHAQTSPEGIQTLFPEAAVQLTREDYKYEYEKIPDMCRDILQSRDPSQRVSIAKSLQTVVLNSLNAKDAVREGGGVRSICRLLALTRSQAVQEHLLVSLECLTFQNDSNCDEVRREGGLKSLCQLMVKSQNLTVKEHVAWTLKNLAATDKNKDALREIGGIGILCKELDDAMDEKVQEQIAWALDVLANDNTKNCQIIHDNGGIRMLSQLVSNTSHEIVLDRATRALAALATEPSNRNVIRLDGGLLAICKRIQGDPSEDFLRVASGALKTVVSNNQHNKEVMKDMGMVHTLQKITSSSTYSSITRRLCCDLLERLIGWAAAGFSASPTKTSAPTTPMTTPTTAPTTTTIVNGTTGSPHSNQVNLGDDIPPLEGSDDDDDNRKKRQVNGTEEVKKVIKVKKQQPLLRPQPKRKQETSDDSDEQDQTDKSYHPFTTWSQTKDTLRIAVRLRGVKKQITDLHDNRLTFSTKLHGKKYHLELDLYDSVITEEKQVDIKGDEVMIVLKKSKSVAWPRLIQSKEKLAYLSIDFDRWEVWSSSEEEQDNNKKKPFVYLPPKPLSTNNVNKKCIVPEMDNTSESSSSDSDGDLGYHGMIDFS